MAERIDEAPTREFLKRQGDENLLERLNQALKQRDREEDLFANVPRDIFICHAHADFERIKPLLDKLEQEENYSLWYSERNLPRDTINYRDNILKAIANCKVFLVFASSFSMGSKDVQWELDAAENFPAERRVEYRLEDRGNNVRFKHFFDGIQWIDGSKQEDYPLLAERLYTALQSKPSSQGNAPGFDLDPFHEADAPAEETPIIDEQNKTVIYGMFPQSLVTDKKIIEALEQMENPEGNGWYLYDGQYYAPLSGLPYNENSFFDSGKPIEEGKNYWFRCDPIKWRILDKGKGCYLLLCDVLLISMVTNPYLGMNGYYVSDVFEWLDGEFFESAFSRGSSYIRMVDVNNSPETVGQSGQPDNPRDDRWDPTFDKAFLPSLADLLNPKYGFSSERGPNAKRCCKTTEYARASGAFIFNPKTNYGQYWTRSPEIRSNSETMAIEEDGEIKTSVNNEDGICVRPCIMLFI